MPWLATWNNLAVHGFASQGMVAQPARPRALRVPGAEVDAPDDSGQAGTVPTCPCYSVSPVSRLRGVRAAERCVRPSEWSDTNEGSSPGIPAGSVLRPRRLRCTGGPRRHLCLLRVLRV